MLRNAATYLRQRIPELAEVTPGLQPLAPMVAAYLWQRIPEGEPGGGREGDMERRGDMGRYPPPGVRR